MNLKHYVVKDMYHVNSYLEFKKDYKIKLLVTERTISFKMFFDFDYDIIKKFELVGENPCDFILEVKYSEDFKDDAYEIRISKKGKITITSKNKRGIRYAFLMLDELYQDNKLPICYIYDEPSFNLRGIVEGFYGTPWKNEERLELISYMDKHRLNCYMYAPKSDLYHREKWQVLYPENEFNELLKIKKECEMHLVDFYYCISPGYAKTIEESFKFSEEEFELLFRKLDQVIDKGVKKFGLLLDDINYHLTDEVKIKFDRPGQAHAYICNRVYDYLKSKNSLNEMLMCPTEYHRTHNSEYKNDLKKYMYPDIPLFFTSDNVCAEIVSEIDIRNAKKDFGHDIYLWDNHPVNDFITARVYLGPVENRSRYLPRYLSAYIINPMIQLEASKLAISTMADYAWNAERYDKLISYTNSVKEFGEEFYQKSKTFLMANDETVMTHGSNYIFNEWVKNNNKKEIKKFYNELLISSKALLDMDLRIIEDLKPWLLRAVKESEFILNYYKNNCALNKEELLEVVQMKEVLGTELLDYLVLKNKWLTEEEYQTNMKVKRGNLWWRIFEDER